MSKEKQNRSVGRNDNIPRAGSVYEYSPKEIAELVKCKQDPIYFAKTYFYINNLDEGRQCIKLYPKQEEALQLVWKNRWSLICASRQIGKSTIMTIIALWQALFKDDQNIYIVANKESTAIEIFKKIKLAYEELPNWLKSGTVKFNEKTLTMANGSSVQVSTTTGTALRGVSINMLILDEFAFVENDREFFLSVLPTVSSSKTAKVMIASTPNGTDNVFSELYHKALAGENNWKTCKILWNDVPGRDEEWAKEQMTLNPDEKAWQQEYECIFFQSGETSVNLKLIEKMRSQCKAPVFVSDDRCYRVWQKPIQGRIYAVGVDTAEGVGADSSVVQVLDITDPRNIIQVAEYASNTINSYEFTIKVREILSEWGDPLALVERNSVGAQVAERLYHEYSYNNLVGYDGVSIGRGIGCRATTESKSSILRNKRYFLNDVQSVTLNSVQLLDELAQFVRKPNGSYSAREGFHDDRVMAFAWALAALERNIAARYLHVSSYDSANQPLTLEPNGEVQHFTFYTDNFIPAEKIEEFMPVSNRATHLDEYIQNGWKVITPLPTGGGKFNKTGAFGSRY